METMICFVKFLNFEGSFGITYTHILHLHFFIFNLKFQFNLKEAASLYLLESLKYSVQI